jgi:UvrD/REP helicase N-terminal domain
VLPLIERDADNLRVEAGPGTGKTFGLVRRIERLLSPEGLGVNGAEVLVVAFNRVIARQLDLAIQQRLETFDHEGDPRIRTIHALYLEVVGEDLRILLPHRGRPNGYEYYFDFNSGKPKDDQGGYSYGNRALCVRGSPKRP